MSIKKINRSWLALGGLTLLACTFVVVQNSESILERLFLRTSVLLSPYLDRPSSYLERPVDTDGDEEADEAPVDEYDYSYNYYISTGEPTDTNITQPSSEPCVAGDSNFYLAGGSYSTYCKYLQFLVSAKTGKQEVFKADITPESPQSRYTTALAILRILKDMGLKVNHSGQSSAWYHKFNDSIEITKSTEQQKEDYLTAYSSGVLRGRINPSDKSQITLAPLEKISYIELLSMFRQAVINTLGKGVTLKESNLPDFILAQYPGNQDWKWIAESYSFGVEYGIVSQNEFNQFNLFNYATRADMVRFLARFKATVRNNKSLLKFN